MSTIVDSYSETNYDDYVAFAVLHPSTDPAKSSAMCQSFTGDGQKLDSAKFYLIKYGATGRFIARLYAHSGTFGESSVPTGAALDSSDPREATSGWSLIEFTGFSGYTLVNGTKYCIVVEAYDGTFDAGDNRALVGEDRSSPTHAGNRARYSDGWVTTATVDCCFYVYGVPVLAVGRSFGYIIG